MSVRKLETSNKRIIKFYADHPHLQFENVNLLFLDILEKVLYDSSNATPSIHSHILSAIQQASDNNKNDIHDLKESMTSLKDSMTSMNTDIISKIIAKFTDIKKEYVDDMRAIVQTNTHEKIGPLLEKNNTILMDKTSLIINTAVPKNQTQHYSQINEMLTAFHKTLTEDTTNMVKTFDNNSIKEFISNFELKSSLMLQPMYSFISSSEDRINNNIASLKDANNVTHGTQSKIIGELGELLSKFRDTDAIQQMNDKQLYSVLTKMYNSAEILKQPSLSIPGILLLKRIRKTNVLIQNRDCEQNISVDDINTFMNIIDEQNCSGIFISQHSGISTKKNYQIEMHNNNIIVFVHNAEYSTSKIEVAVDIIDNLSSRMRQFKSQNEVDCTIPKDVLDAINNEYQLFLSQKNAVIDVFKESQKKVLAQVDEIRFPSLDKYLSTKYSAPIQKPGLKCDMCKSFNANNLKALAAHKRGCARKNLPNNTITIK